MNSRWILTTLWPNVKFNAQFNTGSLLDALCYVGPSNPPAGSWVLLMARVQQRGPYCAALTACPGAVRSHCHRTQQAGHGQPREQPGVLKPALCRIGPRMPTHPLSSNRHHRGPRCVCMKPPLFSLTGVAWVKHMLFHWNWNAHWHAVLFFIINVQ